MATAIDSSVILDVLLGDSQFGESSEAALHATAKNDGLIVCETVLAEIFPVLPARSLVDFLSDWRIEFVPSSLTSAALAGEMFGRYLERGGKRGRVVADFLIAAHAQVHADGLLARDRGYYRDYFTGLNLIDPSQPKSHGH